MHSLYDGYFDQTDIPPNDCHASHDQGVCHFDWLPKNVIFKFRCDWNKMFRYAMQRLALQSVTVHYVEFGDDSVNKQTFSLSSNSFKERFLSLVIVEFLIRCLCSIAHQLNTSTNSHHCGFQALEKINTQEQV